MGGWAAALPPPCFRHSGNSSGETGRCTDTDDEVEAGAGPAGMVLAGGVTSSNIGAVCADAFDAGDEGGAGEGSGTGDCAGDMNAATPSSSSDAPEAASSYPESSSAPAGIILGSEAKAPRNTARKSSASCHRDDAVEAQTSSTAEISPGSRNMTRGLYARSTDRCCKSACSLYRARTRFSIYVGDTQNR